MFFYPLDETDRNELIAESKAQKRYRRQLAAHPDPRDPDHPDEPEELEDESE
jgi:hypothetical protein